MMNLNLFEKFGWLTGKVATEIDTTEKILDDLKKEIYYLC